MNKILFLLPVLLIAFSILITSSVHAKPKKHDGDTKIYLLDKKQRFIYGSRPPEIYSGNCKGEKLRVSSGSWTDSGGRTIQIYTFLGSQLRWDTWKGTAKICVIYGKEEGVGEIYYTNAENGFPTPITIK